MARVTKNWCVFTRRSFVVLVTGTVVYGKGDEAELAEEIAEGHLAEDSEQAPAQREHWSPPLAPGGSLCRAAPSSNELALRLPCPGCSLTWCCGAGVRGGAQHADCHGRIAEVDVPNWRSLLWQPQPQPGSLPHRQPAACRGGTVKLCAWRRPGIATQLDLYASWLS